MAHEKKFLQTKRYDMMFVKDASWDFFDAFNSSEQSQAAFLNDEISSKGKNIDKYLTLTRNRTFEKQRELAAAKTVYLPPDIIRLQQMQTWDGKFQNLSEVLKCLRLPLDIEFQRDSCFTNLEKAAAFVVAHLRQHNELFDSLADMHDKASQWVTSNELIYEARELLVTHRIAIEEAEASIVSQNEDDDDHRDDASDNVSSVRSQADMLSSTISAIDLASLDIHGLKRMNPVLKTNVPPVKSRASTAGSPNSPGKQQLTTLQNTLAELTITQDPVKIAKQKEALDAIQLNVIRLCIEIENLVSAIFICKDRCVKAYASSEIQTDRYKTFDELTARLGEGQHPIEGFFDWRQNGVPGLRPVMVDFFVEVQLMAEARLDLEELMQPTGRKLGAVNSVETNLSRWTLFWSGFDVVLKVVLSLDSLRKCRELFEWYGPGIYLVANPLMLSFHLHSAYEKLEMDGKVQDQINSVAHLRLGNAVVAAKDAWQHQQFLNKWRRSVLTLLEDHAFNWPAVPNVKEDVLNDRLYTAMLVIYIKCGDSIKKSFFWEKKFLSKISTVRGQDALLIGHSTAKINKKLNVPPLESRISRPNQMPRFKPRPEGYSGLLRKVSNAIRASNIFQHSIMHLNGGSTELDSADSSMILEPIEEVRPNQDKAKQFTDLLKKAASTQQDVLQKAEAERLAAQKAVAKPVVAAAMAAKGVHGFRSKVPTMFVKDRNGSPGQFGRRSRMQSVSSTRGGDDGGSGLLRPHSGSVLSPSRSGSILRKASSASGIHTMGGGPGTRSNSVSQRNNSISPQRNGSILRKSSTASAINNDRKSSVMSVASTSSPMKRGVSSRLLGAIVEDNSTTGAKPKSAPGGKKNSVSGGGGRNNSILSAGPSAGNGHRSTTLTTSSTLLASTLEEDSTEEVGNTNLTSSLSPKKTKKKKPTTPVRLTPLLTLGNSMSSDEGTNSDDDDQKPLSLLKVKGEKKKKKKNRKMSSLTTSEGSGADSSDGNPDTPAVKPSSSGRTSRVGSKHKLAIEMAASQKVTRLPPTLEGVKMTRRKESM